MNKFLNLISLVIFFLFISCENNNGKAKNNITSDSLPSKVVEIKDSAKSNFTNDALEAVKSNLDSGSLLITKDLKIDDFILQYPGSYKEGLRSQIEWLIKEWKNVPNPIIATYKGNEFGDYHHINFKNANGKTYDFGQAKNNFGEFTLYDDSEQYVDNPKFLGKKFNVYWNWKIAEFLCCEGEYGKAKAYLPTIVKLELVKN